MHGSSDNLEELRTLLMAGDPESSLVTFPLAALAPYYLSRVQVRSTSRTLIFLSTSTTRAMGSIPCQTIKLKNSMIALQVLGISYAGHNRYHRNSPPSKKAWGS